MRNISFSPPDITDLEIDEVKAALESRWITTSCRTKEFENKIVDFTGASKAVSFSSATAAMEITLRILGIGPGDEVITTPYTYSATAAVINHVGAKIVFADVAPDSFEMDYSKIPELINENTKAIIPVDIAGKMCAYDTIFSIVESKKHLFKANNPMQELYNRIIVMGDGAHSFGARRKGKNSGQVADFTCFSFHAVKNVTTAEGGAVVWKDRAGLDNDYLYHEYMLYSLHGQSKDAQAKSIAGSWEYDIIYTGYKCNMTDVLASIGIKQIERYPKMLKRRHEIVEMYDNAFVKHGLKVINHYGDDFESCGHLYLLRIPGIGVEKRNNIIQELSNAGIAANVHYKPLPMMTAYKNLGFCIEDYPNAYKQYENEITLPLHTLLSDEDVNYVIEHVLKLI